MSSGLCEDSGTSLLLLVIIVKHLDSQVAEQSNLNPGDLVTGMPEGPVL